MTSDGVWPAQFEITDRAAVLVLSDLRALRYLTPFLLGAHTLTSAAELLQRPPSTVAYWIPRFVRVGLLVHLGDQQRAGMPMPRYRAPGRQLVVPFGALPVERRALLLDGGRMRVLRQFLDGLDEAVERDASLSLGFSSDAPHSFAVEMVESDAERAVRGYTDAWMSVRLTADDARQFSRDLEAVIERYVARDVGRRDRGKRYLVHAGIAPEPKVRWRSANDEVP
ncbi:MAG: hypothetical protein JWL72_1359 [Ilumatobacteraceae bacterium]|nr:hypothetical protein [Ilumatobacteraceae bacterium]